MSTTGTDETRQIAGAQTLTDDRLRRLAVEAGKYLDLNRGYSLPTNEIVAQGVAHGYTESEVRGMLRSEGLVDVDSIEVPDQGDLFGDLWRFNDLETLGAKAPTDTTSRFEDWLSRKRQKKLAEDGTQHAVDHAYSLRMASKHSGQAKGVGRSFIKQYDSFTTVWITLSKPQDSGESVAKHASEYWLRKFTRKRREILKELDVYEKSAGVSMLAPALGPKPPTHRHHAEWIPGHVAEEAFSPLEELEGFDVDVIVRHHDSNAVESPDSVHRSELEEDRGPTTALAGEIASNLPILRARNALRERDASNEEWRTADASDAPYYVTEWAACLRLGTDDSIDSPGVRRWQTYGRFKNLAGDAWERIQSDGEASEDAPKVLGGGSHPGDTPDSQASRNASMESVTASTEAETAGQTDAQALGGMSPTDELRDPEREFVEEYLEEVGDPDPDLIDANINRNIEELGGVANAMAIKEAIRRHEGLK